MKSIQEYREGTSPHELFVHLYDKVIGRSICTFTQLMEYVQYLPLNSITETIFRKIFRLIKELYWGVFSPLAPDSYPELWKQLVIPSQKIRGAGDLKRNTSISSIYTAILDIHGYSSFCQKNRRNLSMLQLLDDCIQDDIRNISRKHETLSWRAVGDTIILIGANASSITAAALGIINYFSRRKIIKSEKLVENRIGNKIILPDMTVSAGITGGRTYTPFVITQNGDISGDIINTAARLQNFANILDPEKTRLLMTNHVAHQLQKEKETNDILKDIDYFNLGIFQFKGMDVNVYEVLYRDNQKKKLEYQKDLSALYAAVENGKWRDAVFASLVHLVAGAINTAEKIKIRGKSKNYLLNLCENALQTYNAGTDYKQAIGILEEICEYLALIDEIDPIVPMRAEQILERYKSVLCRFEEHLESDFHHVMNKFLDLRQMELFLKSKKSKEAYDSIKEYGIKQMQKENQKYSWFRIIDEDSELPDFKLYIGKK
ncbi:MAG: hypothetical protein JW874_16440 [Spirochaetales bacterium]|nr:hypothetical protein [Spirochaetales bacterium]